MPRTRYDTVALNHVALVCEAASLLSLYVSFGFDLGGEK